MFEEFCKYVYEEIFINSYDGKTCRKERQLGRSRRQCDAKIKI